MILGIGEHRQNTVRDLRKKLSGIWGRSEHYLKGAREHRPPGGSFKILERYLQIPLSDTRNHTFSLKSHAQRLVDHA